MTERQFGSAAGTIKIGKDFDEPLHEFEEVDESLETYKVANYDRHAKKMVIKEFTVAQMRAGIATMTDRELAAYQRILLFPALRSDETQRLNEIHLKLVKEEIEKRNVKA